MGSGEVPGPLGTEAAKRTCMHWLSGKQKGLGGDPQTYPMPSCLAATALGAEAA